MRSRRQVKGFCAQSFRALHGLYVYLFVPSDPRTGEVTVFKRLQRGGMFGEGALLREHGKASADVVTAMPCELLVLPKAAFHTAMEGYPHVKKDIERIGLARVAQNDHKVDGKRRSTESHLGPHLLGMPGYGARIKGVRGSVGGLVNGQVCTRVTKRHNHIGSGLTAKQFLVEASRLDGERIELVLPSKHLECTQEFAEIKNSQTARNKASKAVRLMGNNRSSVNLSLQELRLRVKREMRKGVEKHGGNLHSFFQELDDDCSGNIDCEELGQTLERWGIPRGKVQAELLFPCIDADGREGISLVELADFVDGKGDDARRAAVLADQMSQEMRMQRIECKTQYQARLRRLAHSLKECIAQSARATRCTAEDMFRSVRRA